VNTDSCFCWGGVDPCTGASCLGCGTALSASTNQWCSGLRSSSPDGEGDWTGKRKTLSLSVDPREAPVAGWSRWRRSYSRTRCSRSSSLVRETSASRSSLGSWYFAQNSPMRLGTCAARRDGEVGEAERPVEREDLGHAVDVRELAVMRPRLDAPAVADHEAHLMRRRCRRGGLQTLVVGIVRGCGRVQGRVAGIGHGDAQAG
jgi:hypothetical protein